MTQELKDKLLTIVDSEIAKDPNADCYLTRGLPLEPIRQAVLDLAKTPGINQIEEKILKPLREKKYAFFAERELRLEYALRHLILQPIKGEITKSKLTWRGIYLKARMPQSRIENKGDKYNVVWIEYYPLVCGKASKSGNRPAFMVSLDFENIPYQMYQYSVWKEQKLKEQERPKTSNS